MDTSPATDGPKTSGFMPREREFTGSQALLGLVRELVETADWPHKGDTFRLDEVQSFPATVLMMLELYGFAKGAESSENIADWAREDPVLRQLFGATLPELETIIRFRKRHHAVLDRFLRQIYELASIMRFGDDQARQTPIDYCAARALDGWFNPRCGPRPEAEAEHRMNTILFVDGMSA